MSLLARCLASGILATLLFVVSGFVSRRFSCIRTRYSRYPEECRTSNYSNCGRSGNLIRYNSNCSCGSQGEARCHRTEWTGVGQAVIAMGEEAVVMDEEGSEVAVDLLGAAVARVVVQQEKNKNLWNEYCDWFDNICFHRVFNAIY